jgi:hypothetical protein
MIGLIKVRVLRLSHKVGWTARRHQHPRFCATSTVIAKLTRKVHSQSSFEAADVALVSFRVPCTDDAKVAPL